MIFKLVGGDADRDRDYTCSLKLDSLTEMEPVFDVGFLLTLVADILEGDFPSVYVTVTFNCTTFHYETFRPLLWKLQGVEEIHVQALCKGADRLLAILASSSVVDGIRRWPCPRLKVISFYHDAHYSTQAVRSMATSRSGEDTAADGVPETLPQAMDLSMLLGTEWEEDNDVDSYEEDSEYEDDSE